MRGLEDESREAESGRALGLQNPFRAGQLTTGGLGVCCLMYVVENITFTACRGERRGSEGPDRGFIITARVIELLKSYP